jgi:monothiol glutaredoxin
MPVGSRLISTEMKDWLQKETKDNDLVLFMKGTPDFPQCGFSRAVVEILRVQDVDFKKVHSFNVLEDPELREGVKEFRFVGLES